MYYVFNTYLLWNSNNGYANAAEFYFVSTSFLTLKLVALEVINGTYRFKSLAWTGWRSHPPLLHFVYGKLLLKFRTENLITNVESEAVRNFRTAWALVLSQAMNTNGYIAVRRVISSYLVMQCVRTVCTWTCGWLFVIEPNQIFTFTVDIRKISPGNTMLFRQFCYACKTFRVKLACLCGRTSSFLVWDLEILWLLLYAF